MLLSSQKLKKNAYPFKLVNLNITRTLLSYYHCFYCSLIFQKKHFLFGNRNPKINYETVVITV